MKSLLASLVMFFVPLLLFWLPVPGAGGLIAGLIAGYLLERPGRAVLHALFPALLLGALVLCLAALLGQALIGAAVASVLLLWLAWTNSLLLLGALLGGLLYQRRRRRLRPPVAPLPVKIVGVRK